jgi:hypothetical protein
MHNRRATPTSLRARLRVALIGAMLVLLDTGWALADFRIRSDLGGQIGPYLRKYATVRDSGQQVVIDGRCVSACTLVVAVIPRERICVTSRAALEFHAAWKRDFFGRPVVHSDATRLLWSLYPPEILGWIRRNGGLNERTIVLRGRELSSLYRACS